MDTDSIINREELRNRLDNDFDLFKDLAEIFLNDSSRLLGNIEEAIKNNDDQKVGKTAHTLKGAVSNFSATRAYEASLHLEKLGKSSNLDEAESAFSSLEEEITLMRKAIDEILEEGAL